MLIGIMILYEGIQISSIPIPLASEENTSERLIHSKFYGNFLHYVSCLIYHTRFSAIMEAIFAFYSYLKLPGVKRNVKRWNFRKMKKFHYSPKCILCIFLIRCFLVRKLDVLTLSQASFLANIFSSLKHVTSRFSAFLGLTLWPRLLSLDRDTIQ